ncbi:hypothetical protein Tco_0807171 [Tanacetum coccineum]
MSIHSGFSSMQFTADYHLPPLPPLPPFLLPPPIDRRQYGWWRKGPMLLREAWAHSDCIGVKVIIRSFRPISDHVYALTEPISWPPDTATDAVYSHSDHNIRRQDQMVVGTLLVIQMILRREMSDIQAELLALREQQRRARQPGPEARIPVHQDASGMPTCSIFDFKGTEGLWSCFKSGGLKKLDQFSIISGWLLRIKYSLPPALSVRCLFDLVDPGQIKNLGPVAYAMMGSTLEKRRTKLYLMRRSLEVLRKFHWMILGGRFNQLSHVSSLLLSKPGEY